MMKMLLVAAAGIATAMLANPAKAMDAQPCAPGMICASAPATIVAALQKAGFKADLTTDSTGDPEVDSAASGYSYQILFYDCVDHTQCAAIQFYSSFKADPSYTEALANKWNLEKRFLRAYVNAKKELVFDYDVTTVGGITQANFADLADWMQASLGDVGKFIDSKKK